MIYRVLFLALIKKLHENPPPTLHSQLAFPVGESDALWDRFTVLRCKRCTLVHEQFKIISMCDCVPGILCPNHVWCRRAIYFSLTKTEEVSIRIPIPCMAYLGRFTMPRILNGIDGSRRRHCWNTGCSTFDTFVNLLVRSAFWFCLT